MSKYGKLGDYLKQAGVDHVSLTFGEIEQIVGTRLPKSKVYPAWWSNSPSNNVMTQIWLDAGYRTEQVDCASERLVFRRAPAGSYSTGEGARKGAGGMKEDASDFKSAQANTAGRHPALGAMKGTFTIEPGYDLTRPALDPDEIAAWEAKLDRIVDEYEAHLAAKYGRKVKR